MNRRDHGRLLLEVAIQRYGDSAEYDDDQVAAGMEACLKELLRLDELNAKLMITAVFEMAARLRVLVERIGDDETFHRFQLETERRLKGASNDRRSHAHAHGL